MRNNAAALWVDTHVHIYPHYNVRRALDCAIGNLPGPRAICLTERSDCHFFDSLKSSPLAGFAVQVTASEDAAKLTRPDGESIWVFPGRQIVTAERLEVLALVTTSEFPDGRPMVETVESILAAGGLPVLAYAPGKWCGTRSAVVETTIKEFGAKILLGDSRHRFGKWEPKFFQIARDVGAKIIAGSDPLPLPSEEAALGQYAVKYQSGIDEQRAAESMRSMITGEVGGIVGSRSNIFEFAIRYLTLKLGGIHLTSINPSRSNSRSICS